MKRSILNHAIRCSLDNLKKHPMYQARRWLHYSFIVQSNKIIEWGMNRAGEPPVHFGYHARIEDNEPKIHAELDAWRKAKLLLKHGESFDILNIRLNRLGQFRLSKPCVCCFTVMRELGCKTFYYSSEVGFLKC